MTSEAELRAELAELRRRLDEIESRLETRADAIEKKQQLDIDELKLRASNAALAISLVERKQANLESLQRASQLAVLHLLGVTARAVRVSEEEIAAAMRMATEITR